MFAVLLVAALAIAPQDSGTLLVRTLDVTDARIGGDAILITDSADGRARHLLIDAGEHGATVVRWLDRFHVDTLAAVILSHPHADHYGGMEDVFAHLPVRTFVYGGTPRTTVTYRRLLADIAARRIPVVTVDSGVRRLTLAVGGDSAVLTVFAPPPSCRALAGRAEGDAVNDCSIGVRLTHGGFSMLFPGDAEIPELAWWLEAPPVPLAADVLKAGHHGSDNATTPAWLDAVHPGAVMISANGRQHPFAGVLALLAARGIATYCTADNGTITVRAPRGGAWTVTPERSGRCHARTDT
ncbi:MAG TPA: MBL fold metallo-hydrolase [Gemmatimonadales bacterium]|nr:MBL fold metallo-hydrolase [Gemmatimonadales bacterium]